VARQYPEAADAFRRLTAPDHTHHAFLAASAAQDGDEAAAKTHADAVLKQEPGFTVSGYLSTVHYKQADDREHHREGLMKAGLPE
jgi:adenylate cyclase